MGEEWRRRERLYLEELESLRERLRGLQTVGVDMTQRLNDLTCSVNRLGEQRPAGGQVPPDTQGGAEGSLHRKFYTVREGDLWRIHAVVPGPWGPAGTRGGLVAHLSNLAQDGDCWVDEPSEVRHPSTRIHGNVEVANSRLTGPCYLEGDGSVVGSSVTALDMSGHAKVNQSTITVSGWVRVRGSNISHSVICGEGELEIGTRGASIVRSRIDTSGATPVIVLGSLLRAEIRRPSDLVQIGTTFGVLRCYRSSGGGKMITVGCKRMDSFDELRALAAEECTSEADAHQLRMLDGFISMVEPLTEDW